MKNQKIFKQLNVKDSIMLPGDLKGLPDESFSKETIVFIDAGFFSKLKKKFGGKDYLKIDLIKFSELLAYKEKSVLKKIFIIMLLLFNQVTLQKKKRREEKNIINLKIL